MKTPRPNRNSILAYLRFAASSAFFAAAAALAFVASSTNVLSTNDVPATKSRLPMIKSSAQDSVRGIARELSEKDGSAQTPQDWAEEQAKIRAYPADETPFTAQLNSIIGVKRFLATSASNATPAPAPKGKLSKKNKKAPAEAPRFNSWSNIGSNTSSDPGILTFSGGPYTTSGRITAMALDTHNGCSAAFCRLWIGAAGGGVWRTTNAAAAVPSWTFLTQINFYTNAIGALTFIDNGTANGILLAGTGEPNASADSEAGLGLFKSTDGGDTWLSLNCTVGPITTNAPGTGTNGTYTGNAFFGRAIADIVADPTNANVLYVSSARSVRGIDSTYGGPTSNPPVPRPPFGLFKSTDGGNTFTFIWDGSGSCPAGCNGSDPLASIRGVTDVRLDPSNHNIVYASTFPGPGGGGGVWRSNDAGTTWTQIKTARNSTRNVDRCAFDVVDLGAFGLPGVTRMYVGCGNDLTSVANQAHVFRSDGVQTGVPVFTDLTAAEVPAGQSVNYCTGQCWYDNVVRAFGPAFPFIVYVAGSYNYGECGGNSDCRGVIVSNTNGDSWFDFTWDAQDNGMPTGPFGQCCNPNQAPVVGPAPNQMHPDHHFILPIPNVAFGGGFFDGSDGGIVRASGGLSNQSGQCTGVRTADGSVSNIPLCQQLLSGVPVQIFNLNAGLNTLQFMSVSYNAFNSFNVQGGTQDNGTFNTFGSFNWNQEIYGDGGQSGFNRNDPTIRFNTFTGQANDGNFRNGDPNWWVEITGPILFSVESSLFYPPIIADPHTAAAGTILQGSFHVWRTQDNGGTKVFLEANCPEFGPYAPFCGDFVPLGGVSGANDQGCLVCAFWGSRAGGAIEAIERTTSNTNVAWATTTAGRVFISTNVNAAAASVVWNRLDPVGATDPTRVPTGVAINPFNTFQGWVSYSGYNFNTPSQPGHVFRVSWSGAGAATYTNITNNLPDIPYTSIVYDPATGDLYVSSDFVVFRLANGQTQWDIAGVGMPLVEIPKLTINPNARVLYAATHGLGVWTLPLY
jgi:hypothetical protein